MKLWKRCYAFLLVFALFFTNLSLPAHAQEPENEVKVILDANGGKFDDGKSSKTVFEGEIGTYIWLDSESTPVYEGETKALLGWSTSADGDVEYRPGAGFNVVESITLYAIWIDGVTVTFDANGGTFKDNTEISVIVPKGYAYDDLNSDVETGCYYWYFRDGASYVNAPQTDMVFSGWSLSKDGSDVVEDGFSYVHNTNVTLYAVYDQKINITIHAGNDGIFNSSALYNADGSSLDSLDIGLSFDKYKSSKRDLYMLAALSDDKKTATFDVPKGTKLSLSDINLFKGMSTVSDKAFLGWSEDANGSTLISGKTFAINDNTNIYAIWGDGVTVTLHSTENGYFGNDSSNTIKKIYVRKNTKLGYYELLESSCNPHAVGTKNFSGWSTDGTANGAVLRSSLDYYDVGTQDIDLYATYSEQTTHTQYKVTYDANGKGYFNVDGKHVNKNVKEEYNTISLTSENGFVANTGTAFVAWSPNPNTSADDINNSSGWLTLSSDITLYPVVTEGYKISLDPGDGSWRKASGDYSQLMNRYGGVLPKGSSLPCGDSYKDALNTPEGKIFIGWTRVKNDRSTMITYEDKLEDNITLYAFFAEKAVITLDANGGYFYGSESNTSITSTVEKGSKYSNTYGVSINDDHKVFIGWSKTPDGDVDNSITNGYSSIYFQTNSAETATYYAVFGDAYNITFYAAGGKLKGEDNLLTTSLKIKKGQSLDYNQPSISNGDKIFIGWSDKETVDEETLLLMNSYNANSDDDELTVYYRDYVPIGDMNLYPIWADPVTITVDYGPEQYCYYSYYNNKTWTYEKSRYQTFKAPKGYVTTNFSGPTYANNANVRVIGYSLTKNGAVLYNNLNNHVFTQDATYYAIYSFGKNITLDSNGGVFSGYTYSPTYKQITTDTVSVVYYDGSTSFGTATSSGNNYGTIPSYTGHTFMGWNTDASAKTGTKDLSKISFKDGMKLYAIWQEQIVHEEFAPSVAETPITQEAYQTVPANDREVENKSSRIISSIRQNLQGTTLTANDVKSPEGSSVMINSITTVKNEAVISSLQDVITSVLKSTKDVQTTVQNVKLVELNASGSGKVKFLVGKEYSGKYAVVGHYHHGTWTTQQCLVDDYGYITPQFASFSPIAIMVTTDSNEVKNLSTKEEELPAATPTSTTSPAPTSTSVAVEDTTPTVDSEQNGVWVTMHRLYNPNSGEHFYTCSVEEKDMLVSVGWNYEGEGWTAPDGVGIPVYRLYNPNSGEHHYTTGEGERNMLISIGWNDEGIGWHSAAESGTPLYRLYNPNATGAQEAGAHHYTKDASERDMLVSIGWNDEGIGWYGL